MKAFRAVSLVLALALVVAPLRGGAAGEPYTIPVIVALTGPFALLGQTQRQALEVFQKYTNDNGGIKGRPLQFEFMDDAGNAATSVQVMNQLIARKVPLVIGPSSVATCRAVAPLVTNGPVDYCLSAGGPTPKGGYSFTAAYSTYDAIHTAVAYFRQKGWDKIGVLEPTDATGQDGEEQLDKALALPENKGVVTVIAREHFSVSDISATAQLSRIKATNPDVLFVWATGAAIATALHGLIDIGWNIPTYASHGNMLFSSMAQYGPLTPKAGLYFVGPQFVAQQYLPTRGPARAAVDTFLKAFAAAGIRPDNAHAAEWDLALCVTEALRHVPAEPTATQIRDALEQIHGLAGAQGMFDFRDGSQRGIAAATILMARWDEPTKNFVAVSAPGGKPFTR
jgi:branched-chain amino acid transport system substrate-binding protein